MVHLSFAIGFSLISLVLLGFALRRVRLLPNEFNGFYLGAIFLLLLVGLITPVPASVLYKAGIGLALLILFIAQCFCMIPGTPYIVRLGSNIVLYFLLTVTFLSTAGGRLLAWPAFLALIPLALVMAAWATHRKRQGDDWVTLLFYSIGLALMLGSAVALAAVRPEVWTFLALGGAILLAATDIIFARHKLRRPVSRLAEWLMALSVLAMMLLAWSVWGTSLLNTF
jgi:hypothetical protein